MWGDSRCKMGASDFPEFAASSPQNLSSYRSSVLRSVSVPLMHDRISEWRIGRIVSLTVIDDWAKNYNFAYFLLLWNSFADTI
jgi:hypothetical protein